MNISKILGKVKEHAVRFIIIIIINGRLRAYRPRAGPTGDRNDTILCIFSTRPRRRGSPYNTSYVTGGSVHLWFISTAILDTGTACQNSKKKIQLNSHVIIRKAF